MALRRKHLRRFLESAFSVDELRQLVHDDPEICDLATSIHWDASPRSVADEVISVLDRNGRLARLRILILEARPHRSGEITAFWTEAGAGPHRRTDSSSRPEHEGPGPKDSMGIGALLLTLAMALVLGVLIFADNNSSGESDTEVVRASTLKGRLRGHDRSPLQDVLVQLDGCSTYTEAVTNAKGIFQFRDLKPDCIRPPIKLFVRHRSAWHSFEILSPPPDIQLPGPKKPTRIEPVSGIDVQPGDRPPSTNPAAERQRPYRIVWMPDGPTVDASSGRGLSDADLARVLPLTRAVGLLEASDDGDFVPRSTAFLVADDIVLTTRHALQEDAAPGANRTSLSRTYCVRFHRELETQNGRCIEVTEALLVHRYWDIALLKLAESIPNATPLELVSERPARLPDTAVAVVGFPGGVFGHKSLQPGLVVELRNLKSNEASKPTVVIVHSTVTFPGSSGSPVLDASSGKVLGVHFASTPAEGGYAIPSWEFAADPDIRAVALKFTAPAGTVSRTIETGALGFDVAPYDPAFLGRDIPLPVLTASLRIQALNDGKPVDYLHYSLILHRERRLAIVGAYNLDRDSLRHLPRDRKANGWTTDPRLPAEAQLTNTTLRNNPLHRSNLVSRHFVSWGAVTESKPLSVQRAFSTGPT